MKYEFMCIIKPFLPEDVRAKLIEDIKKVVTGKKGEIEKEDIWGKRHLAYDIDGHEEGYYLLYYITVPSNEVEEIKETLRMKSDILRFQLIRFD